MRRICFVLALAIAGIPALQAHAQERFITVASTTSTENSGLYEFILPLFTMAAGIEVRVVAVGTGQALQLARNGDADVLFVHHQSSEEQFVEEGFGVQRYDVMYNDFIIVGPTQDPANIRGLNDANTALVAIANISHFFVSRGDDSGTHKKELALWRAVDVNPTANADWYRETGSGMGRTLNVATELDAYTLTDRATWLKFKKKEALVLLVEDERLFNQYGVVLVNEDKHPHVKTQDGQKFIDWVRSKAGQDAINSYTIEGQQAFFANAKP